MILCNSPRIKSGLKLGYVLTNQKLNLIGFSRESVLIGQLVGFTRLVKNAA